MLVALARPLPIPRLLAVASAICTAVALYCLAYSALAGRPESVGEALAWVAVNILPWLLAFEIGKRSRRLVGAAVVLAATLGGSLLLGLLLGGSIEGLPFEAMRRLPALLATAGLIGFVRFVEPRQPAAVEADIELPLAPDQIEWVSAAGNYIEIRGAGRTLIRRASLGAAERELLRHGFVRIHRSTLVRRDRIARVRPADVVLHDGTSLKTGKRYRSGLGS